MEDEYSINRTVILETLAQDRSEIIRMHNYVVSFLLQAIDSAEDDEPEGTPDRQRPTTEAENRRDRYLGRTQNLQNLDDAVGIITMLVNLDYETVGYVPLTNYTHGHYWLNNASPSFTTRFMSFQIQGNNYPIRLGSYLDATNLHAGIPDGLPDSHNPIEDRLASPDGDLRWNVSRTPRPLPSQNKYDLLSAFLDYYVELTSYIRGRYYYIANNTANSELLNPLREEQQEDSPNIADIRNILGTNQIIDGIRSDIAFLYRVYNIDDAPDHIAVRNLTRIASAILDGTAPSLRDTGDETSPNSYDDTGDETSPNSYGDSTDIAFLTFNDLYQHIERSIQLFTILSRFSNGSDDSNIYETIYRVRGYRAYAYAVENSSFHLGKDVLLRGFAGANPTRRTARQNDTDPLVGLYFAWTMALLFLIFAAIKDFLPLVVGRSIYKQIYSFNDKHNPVLLDIGYIKYEANLIEFFRVPQNRIHDRLHGLFICKLLHNQVSPRTTAAQVAEINATIDDSTASKMPLLQAGYALAEIEKIEISRYWEGKTGQLKSAFGVDISDNGSESTGQLKTWLEAHVKRDKTLTKLIADVANIANDETFKQIESIQSS